MILERVDKNLIMERFLKNTFKGEHEMENKIGKLIIVGDGETAQIAYEYFTYDSPYEVIAFSVEKEFLKGKELFGLPVVPFEDMESSYDPEKFMVYVAISYTQLNRIRSRLYKKTKEKGFSLASYVSSKAFVWRTVEIGENCFVFENNVVQHGVKIGNNVILWSGNHIGHQTRITDNCYVASHVVISGFCEIGENCFLGVNCSFNDKIKIAKDCIIGSGAVVIRDTEPGKVYAGNPAKPLKKSSYEAFQVKGGWYEMD
jgi:sugar O-acyltransferase (sialic acid O-acetyltransferase NeuD family)